MNCELCGQRPAAYRSEIEGTMMDVCASCARYGKSERKRNVQVMVREKRPEKKEPMYIFVEGYGAIVKKAREKLGLKQEEMAKRLNERESFLHQVESEHIKPRIEVARKLERELHIHILEEMKDGEGQRTETRNQLRDDREGLTLGDFIKK